MDPADLVTVRNRSEWRRWLSRHHASRRVAWLVYFKGAAAARGVTYEHSVEEALCFGWIDSIIRRLDDARYARKFTPRTNCDNWSELNKARARRMIRAKRMTAVGLAKIRGLDAPPVRRKPAGVPAPFMEALAASPKAGATFDALAPSYRRAYAGWVAAARRPETQAKRIREAIGLLERGRKLGMK